MTQKKNAEPRGPMLDTAALVNRLTPQGGGGPSPRTIERWRMTGEGPPFIKIGRRVIYCESAVEAWLAQRTCSTTNEFSPGRR